MRDPLYQFRRRGEALQESHSFPRLEVAEKDNAYYLTDTRNIIKMLNLANLNKVREFPISLEQAHMVLIGQKRDETSSLQNWAIKNDYCIDIDGLCQPLATCSVDTYSFFEGLNSSSTQEDVQNVFSDLDVPGEVIEALVAVD